MKFVYAASFGLPPEATSTEALKVVGKWFDRGRAPDAVGSDWSEGTRSFDLERGRLDVQVFAAGGDRLWRGTWRHPHSDDTTLDVVSEVSIGDMASEVSVVILIGLVRTRPQLRPLSYNFDAPRLVRDLVVKFRIMDGNTRLSSRPITLGAADVDRFVDETLLDSARTRPVILISSNPQASTPSVDPVKLARKLTGLAHVTQTIYGLPNTLLRRRLGELACWGGAVRIYWPSFAMTDDPSVHSLFNAYRLRNWQGTAFDEYLFRRLSSIATVTMGMLDDHRGFRRSALRHRAKETQDDSQLIEELWNQAETLERENRDLHDSVEVLTLERDDAIVLVDRLKTAVSVVSNAVPTAESEPDPAPADEQPPGNVREAVDRAASCCPHLVFLEAAYESAAASEFRRPDEVLDALMTLETLAKRYCRPEGIGQAPGIAAEELGLRWKGGVSDTNTGGNRSRLYERMWNGEVIRLGPHIALGGGSGAGLTARIYLYMHDDDDPEERRFLVGHVGGHLPDSTT